MIDYTQTLGRLRLLINDIDETAPVFDDNQLTAFLALEGNVLKLAAAQAIDTIADNEVLTAKVLRTQDLTTDGAKAADALRKRAAQLREQAAADIVAGYVNDGPVVTEFVQYPCEPELAGYPGSPGWY